MMIPEKLQLLRPVHYSPSGDFWERGPEVPKRVSRSGSLLRMPFYPFASGEEVFSRKTECVTGNRTLKKICRKGQPRSKMTENPEKRAWNLRLHENVSGES